MRHLGLGHFTFLHLAPIDLVKLARKTGFDFVGLRLHPVAANALHWLPDEPARRELARVMTGEGITLYDSESVVIDASLCAETLAPMMDATAALGGQRINTCADLLPDLTERFARICEMAQARGLGVDLECMAWRGVNTPAACLGLIRDSGASNAHYLVDTLHHLRCGGTPEDIARLPPTCIASAQLCDAPSIAPTEHGGLLAEARGGRLLPGEGGLALADILRALPDHTVVSVELPSTSDQRPDLDRAHAIFAASQALLEHSLS